MVIIQHDYKCINKSEMTDSFLLWLKHIKEIYDIDEGVIGLKFASAFSNAEYKIELEGDYEKMLANELLNLLISSSITNPPIIHGNVKFK
jgi:hypothetical protein